MKKNQLVKKGAAIAIKTRIRFIKQVCYYLENENLIIREKQKNTTLIFLKENQPQKKELGYLINCVRKY